MIHSLHLYDDLDRELIQLLKSLKKEDWDKHTLAPKWSVKDIASHMLDTTLRGISTSRDGHFGEAPPQINGYSDLEAFLNQLNADWVKATKRLSPELLILLLETMLPILSSHMKSLDLEAKALFSVDWAGEELSKNWFHCAREYTEKYHHQMQIRAAVGKEEVLLAEKWYLPYLDTSMQALPHHYRDIVAEEGSSIKFSIAEISKNWVLSFRNKSWVLEDEAEAFASEVIIPGKIAWKLFTKGISADKARNQIHISGDQRLGEHILKLIAVIA
ncbi:MAG: maleylpyruvate isomerase N-terminal domain-containing protein [Bacteroidota bacterium]